MLILRVVKGRFCWRYLSNDSLFYGAFLHCSLKNVARGQRVLQLLTGGWVYRRSVHGTDIVSLAHELGWVMRLPQLLKKFCEGHSIRVENHLHNLVVGSLACPDFIIGRIWCKASLIAYSSWVNTLHLPKYSFSTPEAAHTKGAGFVPSRPRSLQLSFEFEMLLCKSLHGRVSACKRGWSIAQSPFVTFLGCTRRFLHFFLHLS